MIRKLHADERLRLLVELAAIVDGTELASVLEFLRGRLNQGRYRQAVEEIERRRRATKNPQPAATVAGDELDTTTPKRKESSDAVI